MNRKELEAFAREAAKSIKTEKDLNSFSQILTKITVEAALNVEVDEHLGYNKHQKSTTDNYRNGFSRKTLKTENSQFEINIPRDRQSKFEPQLIKKHQIRDASKKWTMSIRNWKSALNRFMIEHEDQLADYI